MSTLKQLLDDNPEIRSVEINDVGTERFQIRRFMPVVEGDSFLVVDHFIRDEELICILAWNEWNYIEVRGDRGYWVDPSQKERR